MTGVIDRRNTGSEKWERWAGRDVLPMWVADMDFAAPPCVLDALHSRLEHGVLGYTRTMPSFGLALAGWLERRHGWRIDPGWVLSAPGMVVAMDQAARILGEPGSDGLVLTPIYPPFLRAPGHAGRRCVRVPLAGGAIDWDALERAATPSAKVLWLCSPHNPSGRVWTRAELERLGAFVLTHDLHVVSDEAWMDLVLEPGCRHIPFATLSPALAARAITILAPSKTFNIPGLSCAAVVIPDANLRAAYAKADLGLVPWPNLLGLTAAESAWNHGDAWLDSVLLPQLRANRDTVHAAVNALPGLSSRLPEATYLTWIDCTARGWDDPAAVCEAAGLGLSDGRPFEGPGCVRLNYGCPAATLAEGLRRLRLAAAP